MNKKYIIEVATNPASLKNLRDELQKATTLPDGIDIPSLSRESKAQIKKDLATMFGVAEHQAEALQTMMQAVADGFASNKNVSSMKKELKGTLDFIDGIMKNMAKMGDSTDWMKQGVSFVDDFIKMKESITTVEGLEKSVTKLNKSFKVFQDALAETNADAYLKRFGNSTRSEAESLARAQKELDKIIKTRNYSLSKAIEKGQGEYDYTGYSKEKIEAEYKSLIQIIESSNQEIENLRKQYKGKTSELYSNKDYQKQITALSTATNKLKNLPGTFGDSIDANLKISLKEATDSVQEASNEIKNILDGLQKEGIELSITLPDADSEKFVSQINDFVAKATKQFKTKPIEVAATIKNPFKETKTEEGLESNNIADNFTKSIATVKEAINNGYKELRTAVNSESSLLNKELFLKFGYKKSDTDSLVTDALESMQNTIYESNPLEINFNTESVAEKLAEDIQSALKNIKMPSIPTANISNAQASTIPVRVVGGLPLKIETQDGSKQPESLSVPKKIPTPPVQNKVDEKTEVVQTDNTNAIKTSSEVQRALNKALTSLNATIQTQNNIIDRNQRTIKDYEDSASGEEETREINNLKSDIAKLREKLIEPEKKEQTIRDEQSKLFVKYNQAKSAYDTHYEELASNEAYKDIKKFDERLRILRANRDETDREYRAQISEFDKKILDAQKKLGKSKKDDAYWNRAIEDYTKQRAEIETKRQGKLKKLDDGISGVEAERKNALSTNAAAQQIAKELEPLALAIVEARKQLNAKSQELHNITSETDKIKTELGKKEEQLESKTHSKEIDAAQKKIDAAQKKTEPLSKRRDMIQSILDNNQDPVKLVLDATNQFWETSAKTINSAQNSMLRYASDDAMKTKLKDAFEKQTKLESLDPKSDDYKKLKADIDKIWNEIDEAAKSLTDKNAHNFNVSKSKYNNSYIRRNSMALQGLTDMSDLDEEEALNIVTSLLKKNKVTSSRISKIPSTPLLKDLSEYVKISKTALGVQDQTDEQYDADIKAQNAFLQTARNIELLKRLEKAFPKNIESQLEKQISQLKNGNYVSLDADTVSKLVGENPSLNIQQIIEEKEAELKKIKSTGKFDRLPSPTTIENFIKAFSGFEEMEDVVESATQYLNALNEVKKVTDSNPAFKSLSAPEIMQKLYGNLSDDAKSKLSVALDGYGLKDVNISELEGNALVDAINKMTTAFQNKAFDNLDINENAIKGIINVLQRNASLMSAKEQLEFAVESRRRYLDGSKYTTQGRVPGTARTKTDNVYDVLKSNEPLSVEVVNGDKSWVASIYNPKGAPGQADKSYKANSYGFGNFLYESGIRKEMDAIVEASIRETYLDNISKRLESWYDGYKPSKNEIVQMFDSLGGDLKPEDYIDTNDAVIEVDELRRYVQQQKEDMVTAKQLLDELISSGKIRVAIGKNSIVPNYAKDSGAYREIEADEKKQADKEAELESTISKLKSLTVEDQAKKIQSSYNYLNDDEKSRFSTILSGYGLKDIDISKLDGKELINVFNKIKTALANESELESLISGIKSQNPKDQATEMQTKYNSLSKDSKAKINAILSKYNLKGKDISKFKGEKLTDAFDVMKKALGEDSLKSLYGIKRKNGERPFSSILSKFNIEEDITRLEAELAQLRAIRIAQEQEVDKIIVIDKDIATHTAKADHAQKGVNAAKSVSKNLSRWGNESNYYKNATKKEKHKYEYGHISIDELLENINFAKIYGIGDTSALEEVVSTYNRAIAEKRSLEESGTTGETLEAAIAAVDAAEQNLINKYFGTDGWYVTKWLREQFASVNVKNESDMQSVQRELDSESKKQDKILSELEKVHVERIQQINNDTSQMISTYLDSSKIDINAEKYQREKAISDKKKDIDKQILALNSEADKNPKIAALKAKAIKSFETEEYKALNAAYQKAVTSNNPADKELAKTYKAQLDAYEADYRTAKEKWIKNRTNQLIKEFENFVQNIEQSSYPKANEHSDKIASKKAEIEKRKKALTKEVNKDKEIKKLKTNRDTIKKKIDIADEVGDTESSRKLKQEYFNTDEKYRIAKENWIAKKSADLDKELIEFVEELEAEGRSVEKFNSSLSEGEKPVISAAEIRARIQERNAKLLQEENDRFRQELEESVKSTNVGSESLDKRKDEVEAEAQKLKQDAIDRVTKHGKVMTDSEFMASQYDAISKSRAEEVANEKEEARLLKEKRDAIQTQHAIQDDIIAERKSTLKTEVVEDIAPTGTFEDNTNAGRSTSGPVQFLSALDVSNLTADSMLVNGDQGGIIGLLGQIAKDGTLQSVFGTLQSILSTLSNGIKVTSDKNGGKKKGKKKSKDSDDNATTLSDSEALSKLQEKIKADYSEFASVSNSRAVSGGHAIDVFQYKNLDKIKEARADIARLNAEGKAGTEEWNEAQQKLNALLTEQEKITLKINTDTGKITTKSSFQNLAVGAKAASKELQNVDNMMSQLHDAGALSLGADGLVSSSNQSVQNYLNSLRQLQTYKDSLSQDMLFDPSTQQQLSQLTLTTQNYRKEVMSLLKTTSQLNVGKLIDTDKLADGIEELSNDEIKKLMLDIVSDGNKLETKFKELIPVTDEFGEVVGYQLAYTLRTGKNTVQEMTASLNPLTNELRVQKGAVKEVATGWQQFFAGLKGKAASIMQYLISITSIHDVFRYVGQGVQYVREIDGALTELKKVTDETDASYAKFLQNMSKTGSVIGATVADLTTSAADWARLGYSMQEAGELAKNTSILMNVSEFEDVNQATETLISALQAFKKEGQDVGVFSMEIIDKYNEVGNNYAISTSDLAESLTRSSAALVAANNSLEQSIAMTAAANTTIQDPESVGNALKTVSMRIRGVKTELEEAGEDTEGMVTNTAKLQEKIMALTNIDGSGGVDILTRSGDFKSTYDILLEISKIWKDMGDVEQAALLELVAGKTRGSVVAALFQNGDVLEDAYKSATDASGSAMKELNNHLDSIQGRIDLFNNSLQTMWMNFINADVVKFIVDIGTGLIKLVDTLGIIPTLLGAFGGFKIIKSTLSGDAFKGFAESISGAIKAGDLLTAETQKIAASLIKEGAAVALANSSLVKYAITSGIVTKEQVLNMTTTELLGAAFLGLAAKVKTAAIAMAKFLFTTPVGWAILAVTAITSVIAAYNKFGPTHKNYIEKLEEETEILKSVQSELQAVQSELKSTASRMDELQAKGTLSFVEEEELNRLKQQTKELERQEQILQAQEKRARNNQISTAMSAIKTDPDLKGINWSAIFSGIVSNSVTGNIGLTNQSIDDTYVDKYQTNIEELKKAKEDLVKAEQDLASFPKAEGRAYKKAEDAVKQAQERVDKYNNAIDSLSESWATKYGEIGYIENVSTDLEKQWNELYRQHQDYLSQQAFINGDIGKVDILDKTFGATATDTAKKFKKEFEEAVNSGKDPSDVINELFKNQDYSSAFSGLEKQFGITMGNIKDYFTKTGEFVVENPEFDITKYASDIKSHSAVISEFQEAIQKLGKGSFTMDDYLDLIERFPDLAKGVDISSNAFYGLSRNLNKAIKSRTKSFIDDLKELKKSLVAAGKSTDSIDQLIEAIENMPDDALDDTIEKYGTLADKIDRARTAQDKLLASMEENPNQGYESRGEAMDYMKEAMKNGEIGSESNLWNVAKQYGFTYDSAKTINENADALAKFIAIREKWFKQNDDGDDRTNDGYSYEGTESFIKSVEEAVNANAELQSLLKWNYDEKTGTFDFDFDNKNFDKIISLLSQTEELAGLTSDEWMDMMVQIGQFFDVKWEKASDVEYYISKIAEGSGEASDKIEQMTDSVKAYVEKALGTELDFSSLTEASIMALDCDDDIKQLLKTYLTLKQTLEDPVNGSGIDSDPLKISEALLDGNISKLKEIEALQGAIKEDSKTGFTVLDTDAFRTVLEESGYAKDKIEELIIKIQEYNNVVSTSGNEDPLGLKWIESANPLVKIDALKASLSTLGVGFNESIGAWFDGQKEIKINVPDLVSTLQGKGWNEESIRNYCNQLANTNIEGFKILVNQTQLDEALEKSNEIPEKENTTYTVDGSGLQTLKDIKKAADNIPTDIKTTHTTEEVIVQKTETDDGSDDEFNLLKPSTWFKTSDVNGTAHAQGSWGAPKTETALTGELGPEILVRGNKWTTVGENGAEFTQVKKGDIIFNHKQTESLLKNGYVTGRGKAYASGTAFVDGGGMFSKYTFSGEGGYIKYDVNGNELDRFGEAMSEAAGDIEDAADEFKETFDWIEVRIEELDEVLGLLGAQLENATNYSAKNNIIDKIIGTNENKMENLAAGIEKYAQYASTLLAKIPEEYKQAAQDGAIAITEFAGEADEATVEAISNYREWAQKVADLRQQLEEVKTELKELAVQKFDNARESGDVRTTVEDSQTEKLQNAVDLIEEKGEIADAAYYEAMMENSNKKIEYLTKSRNAMQKELDDAVASGRIERGSNEWYELVNQMYEVDAAIDEATLELEQFQNAINDIEWENFDQLINRIGYLKDETQSLIDLMDSDDLFTKQTGKDYWGSEDVTWTDEGLAALGLYAQQMEIAEYEARQYGEAIDKLTADYEAGLYSESEYHEKLNELKSAQYDSIEAYEDAKDAIVDLNKARIDHVKEGIEKEIDAYSELIEKKKEALDAEKDLHDFQKSVMDQQKDIADIQRQLDALAYDDSASARAKKAQLQAELAEANEALEETYYDRSIENQQEALDKELEDFQEAKEKEIEELDLYLENVEQVVADSLMTVQANATTVYDTLNAKADEYGLNVSDAITKPWQDGSLAVSDYQETFDTAASSTMDQLDAMKNKWQEVIDKMQEASDINVEEINKENANYAKATVKSEPAKTLNSAPPSNAKAAPSVGSTVTVKKSATNFSSNSKNAKMASFVPGGSYTVYEVSGGQVLIGRNGVYTGWVKQTDLEGYAKGTKSASKDQLAILDELGEELQLVPGANGRLEYIKKGTSIIPAKMTERLMDLVIDPQEMLDRNRPQIGAHPEVHNTEIKLDITYGDMVSIGEFHGDNLADLEKMVAKQFEKHTKNLNNSIRKYVR